MKKNKKTILIAAGGGLLVVTSVAIAIPVILSSSNSDQQAIKEAQAALEKLTTAQKTVDLTKDANQKLPSTFKITSMETLNALIKGVIIVPNGVTYAPQVITTNNAKGEIVVKIEIQKGAVSATVNFTIVGFIATSQVQADLEATLAKIKVDAISGDENQLPSSMTSISVGALKGFPQTTTNGVHFSAIPKTAIDAAGTLTIILTITKGKINKAKELTISGFKKQSHEEAIKEALTKIVTNTISGDVTKLPSSMTLALIATLKGFPQTTTNKVSFSVVSKDADDTKGQLQITLKATKGDASEEKEITISGFQTQTNQAAVEATLAKIDNGTISGDKTKLPSTMELEEIVVLTSFPPTTTNKVSFSVVSKDSGDDTKGQLEITLKATKGDASEEKSITISGFQTQTQANLITVEAALKAIDNDSISGDNTELPSTILLTSIAYLSSGFPQTVRDISFSVIRKGDHDDTKGQLEIILRATKGDASQEKSITISGFQTQTQAQVDSIIVATALKAINNDTISGDNTKLPSVIALASITTLIGFPQTTASGVHFSVVAKDNEDDRIGHLTITLRATKGDASQDKSIRIVGFDSTKAQAIWPKLRAIKKLFDEFGETTINNKKILVNKKIIIDMRSFFNETILTIPSDELVFDNLNWIVTYKIHDITSQLVTFLFREADHQNGDLTVTSVVKVSGFTPVSKAQYYKAIISATTTTTTKELDKLPLAATYNSITEFNSKTDANLPKPDLGVSVSITWKDNDGNKVVTFTITKDGKTATHDITVTGFKSQNQIDMKALNYYKKLFGKTTTTINSSLPPTHVNDYEYANLDDLNAKTSTALPPASMGISVNVSITNNENGRKVVYLIFKKGDASIDHQFIVTGFKKS